MTVRMLMDYLGYQAGNLATLDAGTEAGLIANKMASANLTGGTAYAAPVSNIRVDTPVRLGGDGIVGTDGSILSKGWALRSSMEAALKSNALIDTVIAPAPTWAASTSYLYGQCVRGSAAGSTTNVYMLAGSTSATGGAITGVSAVSGGPTGLGPALITDNTAVWMYIGSARAVNAKPLYSTVTPTTSSDVMDGYIAFASANNYGAMGLVAQSSMVAASPLIAMHNCNLSDAITIIPKNGGTLAAPSRLTSSIKYAARLVTNAKKWIAFGGSPLYQYSNVIKQIKINGKFLSESVSIGFAGALINPGAVLLDLSSLPPGNKTIEIFGIGNFTDLASSIAVQANEFVYPLPQNAAVKIAIEGDSITDMTYLSDVDWFARIEVSLNEYTGCQNILNNAIGGTGLISNNSGNATTYIQRLQDIVQFSPDMLIINGAHNDDQSTTAARLTAMTTYLKAVRAALPACSIGVVGANFLAGESAAGSQLAVEQDWLTAYNMFKQSDKNCFFIPVLTASPQLLTSANGYMFQSSGAPAPYTNGHPISWYYYHMNRLIADGIRKFLSAR